MACKCHMQPKQSRFRPILRYLNLNFLVFSKTVHTYGFQLKRVSVTTTASVCKPTTRATQALLFWPTWRASSVCKPTTFVVTERGLTQFYSVQFQTSFWQNLNPFSGTFPISNSKPQNPEYSKKEAINMLTSSKAGLKKRIEERDFVTRYQ